VLNREEAPNGSQGMLSDAAWCEHKYLVLAINPATRYCYARCLRCLFTGPERRSGKAARLALRVLKARTEANLQGLTASSAEESEQLEQFERRLERRLTPGIRWRLRYNCTKPWLRSGLQAVSSVLLAAAVATTTFYLLVI
jgi:hypothetical protein